MDPPVLSYFLDRQFRGRAEERWLGDLLGLAIWEIWRAFAIASRDFLLVHAGAVVRDGAALLLPGEMDAGKSSLTLALLRHGFTYLSDEFGALDPVTGRAYPVERPISLDTEALELFPGLEDMLQDKREIPIRLSKRFVRPQDVGTEVARPSDVRWIVFPEATFDGSPRLVPTTKAEAVERLVGNAFNTDRYQERALILLGRIVGDAQPYRLVGGSPLERAELLAGFLS